MSVLLSLLIGTSAIVLGKYLFKKWFNHLFIYSASWMIFVSLYELRLIRYISINEETWVLVVSTFLFFCLGILTIFSARACFNRQSNRMPNLLKNPILEENDKIERAINLYLILFTVIGLIGAIQHWYVLINKFGSIPAALIEANLIYKLRVKGDIEGTIPYLNAFSYAAVFLGGIVTAYKGRLTLRASAPFIAVIIHGLASVGRAGIFLAFLEFAIVFFLFRHLITNSSTKFKASKKNIVIAVFIILILFIGSTTIIRTIRGTFEEYKASTQTLKTLEKSYLITPSIYFYFSSNIGVLSKYFEHGGEEKLFGENTFLPVYNLLSRFGLVHELQIYPKGYYIPIWSNSATFIRELHEDYGYVGVFLFPFLLGLITTLYWYKFFENFNFYHFIILVYLNLIVAFSVFYTITRAAVWILSLLILFATFNYIIGHKNRLNKIEI